MDESTQTELLGMAVIIGRIGFALRQTEARLAEVEAKLAEIEATSKEQS